MTEVEWYALGNPPGSFDDVLKMGRENARRIYRASRTSHPWDEWDLDEPTPSTEPAQGGTE